MSVFSVVGLLDEISRAGVEQETHVIARALEFGRERQWITDAQVRRAAGAAPESAVMALRPSVVKVYMVGHHETCARADSCGTSFSAATESLSLAGLFLALHAKAAIAG